jgi:hypothetical protein
VQRFTTEVCLDVVVEIRGAVSARPGRYEDRPERCYPAEPEAAEFTVWLCGDAARMDITPVLPADVLDALGEEALEQVRDAAAAALLP